MNSDHGSFHDLCCGTLDQVVDCLVLSTGVKVVQTTEGVADTTVTLRSRVHTFDEQRNVGQSSFELVNEVMSFFYGATYLFSNLLDSTAVELGEHDDLATLAVVAEVFLEVSKLTPDRCCIEGMEIMTRE